MATPWVDSVRRRRQLSVYQDGSMARGNWNGVFNRAVSEFNELSGRHNFGVTLTVSPDRPANHGLGGADVMVSAGSGAVAIPYGGSQQQVQIPDVLRGNAYNVSARQGGPFLKSFVYVPSEPMVDRGSPRGPHPAAPEVLLCILVHEFVHCCGLSNADHHQAYGVFRANFTWCPDLGDGEGVELGRGWVNNLPARMPPIVLDERTPLLIRSLWATDLETPAVSPDRTARLGRGPLAREVRTATPDATAVSPSPRGGTSRVPGPQGLGQ